MQQPTTISVNFFFFLIVKLSANKSVHKSHAKPYKVLPKTVFNTWGFFVHCILCIMEAFVLEQCITICDKSNRPYVRQNG